VALAEHFIEQKLSTIEAKEFLGETVTWKEPNVSEPGVYRDAETGEAIVVYAPYPGETPALRQAVFSAKMSETVRTGSGSNNVSRVFGFTTRSVTQQREACRSTSFALESPGPQRTLDGAAGVLSEYLKAELPEVYEDDLQRVSAVLPEWRMSEDSLWTSGVINQSSQLPYHVDGANFDTWSAMPILRRGMDGGHLHMPEYDITLNCRDGWAIWFNGYRYVHGVTPMAARQKDGYRYTMVFYAKKGMKDCHTYAVEIGEARKKRKARELAAVGEDAEARLSRMREVTGNNPVATKQYNPRAKQTT
jgi:hypothetical protein